MRSLADFLHLRNTSTSSTASASSTSTRSFGSPAHARSEEPQDLDHTRRQQASTPTKGQASGHTLAQSTSALHSIAAREELPTGTAGKRQRAASTDVVRLLGSQAGGSTPNLLGGRDVSVRSDAASVRSAYFAGSALAEEGREDLDAEPDVYRGQRQAPLFAPGSAQARSSRRAGGSVSSIGSVADAIAVGSASRTAGPAYTSQPPARTLPTPSQQSHGPSFPTSSMPWGQALGRPPPSPSRRSTQSLAEREGKPMISPIGTVFPGSHGTSRGPSPHSSIPLSAAPICVTAADKAAAIALRRRSRVRSNSASSAVSLNLFGLGPSGGPHSASASVSGSARSSVQLDAIDLPTQKPAPIGVPLPATPVEAASQPGGIPAVTVVPDADHIEEFGRTMSSYASSSTIRRLNASTTTLCEPATPRPVPTGSSETTPIAASPSHLPSFTSMRSHKLSPMDAGVRVKRDLSTVSFWKDGLQSELDGIWAGMADSPEGLSAHVEERETRRRPRPPLVLADSFKRREEAQTSRLSRDGAFDGGGPPLSAVGRLVHDAGQMLNSPSGSRMSTSVSDISLTNMHFPMPPTHIAIQAATPAVTPLRSEVEEDASGGDLTLQPLPARADSSSSARSSLSSGDGGSDLPWYSSQERAAMRNSATSSAWNLMRSPTWSSTTGSVASPRTPAAPSFENVPGLPEVYEGEAARDKSNNIDQLARLLLPFDGQDTDEEMAVYGKHSEDMGEEEGICWGEAI